jgi:hypothetical protein
VGVRKLMKREAKPIIFPLHESRDGDFDLFG